MGSFFCELMVWINGTHGRIDQEIRLSSPPGGIRSFPQSIPTAQDPINQMLSLYGENYSFVSITVMVRISHQRVCQWEKGLSDMGRMRAGEENRTPAISLGS